MFNSITIILLSLALILLAFAYSLSMSKKEPSQRFYSEALTPDGNVEIQFPSDDNNTTIGYTAQLSDAISKSLHLTNGSFAKIRVSEFRNVIHFDATLQGECKEKTRYELVDGKKIQRVPLPDGNVVWGVITKEVEVTVCP